jgi:hypothetical protein
MRNYLLDYYKILLAILVVGIHTSPFLEYSKPLSFIFNLGIFRLAVPTFFLINGYYAIVALETKENLKKYLLRVLKLYVFWTILYFPLFMYTHDFSIKNIVWGIIVVFYGYGHLWYVTALLGGMALFYYLLQHYSKKTILILAVIFYFLGCFIELLQDNYCRSGTGFIVEVAHLQVWKLNFIFFAFPFISVGYYLKKEVKQFYFLRYLNVALLLFIIELVCSYYFLPLGRNMLFSLLLVTPCIFYFFITKNYFENKTFFLSDYIDKLPNSIYYVHGLVVFFSHYLLTNISNTNRFIIVSFFSILIGIFLIKINKFIYNKFRFYIV